MLPFARRVPRCFDCTVFFGLFTPLCRVGPGLDSRRERPRPVPCWRGFRPRHRLAGLPGPAPARHGVGLLAQGRRRRFGFGLPYPMQRACRAFTSLRLEVFWRRGRGRARRTRGRTVRDLHAHSGQGPQGPPHSTCNTGDGSNTPRGGVNDPLAAIKHRRRIQHRRSPQHET